MSTTEKGESRIKATRKLATVDVCVGIIGAKKALDTAENLELYRLLTSDQ